jgi:hypothetical protein
MPGPIRNQNPFANQLQNFIRENEGQSIEVVNVSESPENVYATDGVEVRANSWDQFADQLPNLQEGDVLRVRTHGSNGNVSNWITLQANGLQPTDTRNAQVFAEAVGLEANDQGGIDIIYLGDGMVSEPGAQIRMTNERTGETFDATIDENGQLPGSLQLNGEPGDNFSIAVSDGVNNTDFSEVAGTTTVEGAPQIQISDPTVWSKKHVDNDGKATLSTNRFSGPLFIDGPSMEDVKQGNLANCYFASAAASIAHTDAEKLQEIIQDNGDGTYTFTFQKRDFYGRMTPKKVTVDADLYVKSEGSSTPMYGNSNGAERGLDKMELWFPLLEKAYAAFKGNAYDNIGNGGTPSDVMAEVLGAQTSYDKLTPRSADRIWNNLKEAQENGWPATATTYGKDSAEAERYAGERVYPWHVYSVMGVEEKDGEKFVKIRNPWGNTEPGYDGKNDGIFTLSLERFTHFYMGVDIGKG